MILAVDIGNTAIKLAVVDAITVYDHLRTTPSNFLQDIRHMLDNYPDLDTACICQVGKFPIKLLQELESLVKVMHIDQHTNLPFENRYQSDTLGNDRIALVAGATSDQFKNQDILIVDAGTCVTYDFINKKQQYMGGAISPGLRLRYESLHNFTASLPLLQPQAVQGFTGNTTQDSIHMGVVQGLALEVKGMIKKYQKKYKNLHVIITGGDADLLIKQLKNRFFATPFLMLHGIHNLYKFNS
jgi:type III pantothenate kinase